MVSGEFMEDFVHCRRKSKGRKLCLSLSRTCLFDQIQGNKEPENMTSAAHTDRPIYAAYIISLERHKI